MRCCFRFGLALLAFALLLVASRPALACQYASCQSDGAVPLPAGAKLSLPFKAGEHVYVLSGYGPTGGSSLHCRASDSSCANDWYALDLNLPDYASSGKGQPVLAAADGTVLDAGWGSAGWANYGQRVYIHHDFGDGHVYTTMYAHLDTIAVTTGQSVKKGDVIGTLGQSCQGALSCSSFATPHTHFAVHQDASFGGTGSGGSYGGHAVIPEPIDGYTGLSQGQTLTSNNNGTTTPPVTGCNIVIPPAGLTLEEDGPCGEVMNGPLGDMTGHAGHAFWSTADTPDPDYAQGLFWHLDFAQAGTYQLSAYVPTLANATSGATYKIQHGTQAIKVLIDQSLTQGGWVDLGSYDFAAGDGQWVRLGDNYVNASDNGKAFAIDALRVSPVSGGDAGPAPDSGLVADAGGWTDAGSPDDAGSDDAGTSAQPSRGATSGAGGGCGCRVGGGAPFTPGSVLLAALGLGLFVVRRRGA